MENQTMEDINADLKKYSDLCMKNDMQDEALYIEYDVKKGLRD